MATDQGPARIDRARLRSQRLRGVNFQGDALRLGMNWTEDDLGKPQVLVESAYGMGHPGTFHFRGLIEEVSNGVFEAGGKPADFVVSDICDGGRPGDRGHELLARLAGRHGGDDRDPRTRASARRDGADLRQRQVGPGAARRDRPLRPAGRARAGRHPAQRARLRHVEQAVVDGRGVQARRARPRRSRTRSSSTPRSAARRTRCCTCPRSPRRPASRSRSTTSIASIGRCPVLANVKTTGRYPVEYFWYAGGVPALMLELRDLLHLDCLTVTGRTLGENLEEIERSPFFMRERLGYLRNLRIDRDEIIRPRDDPFGPDGGLAILRAGERGRSRLTPRRVSARRGRRSRRRTPRAARGRATSRRGSA